MPLPIILQPISIHPKSPFSIHNPPPPSPLPPPPPPQEKSLTHSLTHSFPTPITPHPTPHKRAIIPKPKLSPIVRQPVPAPEPAPHQLVVARSPRARPPATARPQRQLHAVDVLVRVDALGFDGEVG